MPKPKYPKIIKTSNNSYSVSHVFNNYNKLNTVSDLLIDSNDSDKVTKAFIILQNNNLIELEGIDRQWYEYIAYAKAEVNEMLEQINALLTSPREINFKAIQKAFEKDCQQSRFVIIRKTDKSIQAHVHFDHFPVLVSVGEIDKQDLLLQANEIPNWDLVTWKLLGNTAKAFPFGFVSTWRNPSTYFTASEPCIAFGHGQQVLVKFSKGSSLFS